MCCFWYCFVSNFLLEFLLADLPRKNFNDILVFVERRILSGICYIWNGTPIPFKIGWCSPKHWPSFLFQLSLYEHMFPVSTTNMRFVRIFFSPHGVGLLSCRLMISVFPFGCMFIIAPCFNSVNYLFSIFFTYLTFFSIHGTITLY